MPFRLRARDVTIPLIVLVFQVTGSHWAERFQILDEHLQRVPLDAFGHLLLMAGPAALVFRRRHPVPVLIATLLVTVTYTLAGYAYGPVYLSPMIGLYSAIVSGHRRAAWIGSALMWVFFAVYATWLIPFPQGWFHNLSIAAIVAVVVTVSEVSRATRERRAEHQRAAEEESRRQASEERLTMAQELHDVLAHNISLIHVQASTALHLIDEHPEQARTALATIKQASKDVLGEMRSVLNVLRDGAPRSPTAGMDRVDELIERSGPGIAKRVGGRVRPLPASVDRAAYRIVQEALTNVTKHAPGSKASVDIDYGERTLVIRVEDDGTGRPGSLTGEGGGNGIPGMRERAAALGGVLTAGRRPEGGFRVEARLPIAEETT